jgi:hypothetical protein
MDEQERPTAAATSGRPTDASAGRRAAIDTNSRKEVLQKFRTRCCGRDIQAVIDLLPLVAPMAPKPVLIIGEGCGGINLTQRFDEFAEFGVGEDVVEGLEDPVLVGAPDQIVDGALRRGQSQVERDSPRRRVREIDRVDAAARLVESVALQRIVRVEIVGVVARSARRSPTHRAASRFRCRPKP